MATVAVELYYDENNMRPCVWLVWAGVQTIAETHNLRAICSSEEKAKERVDYQERGEAYYYQEYDREPLHYWYERMWLDHLYGEECMNAAREAMKGWKSRRAKYQRDGD